MKIIISKDRHIEEIKKEFNEVFPYLKIDFTSKFNSPKGIIKRFGPLRIGDIGNGISEGTIILNENLSIKQVIHRFEENFGLDTHFFRKSGNSWVEIKATGDWSLKQQNERGMEVF